LDFGDDGFDGLVDAPLEIHRVHARGDGLGAFVDDRLRENRGGRRAVARFVAGAAGDFTNHLRAHVLELVLKLDLLGDGDAVFTDPRRTEGLIENDVASFGSKGHTHRVRQGVDPFDHAVARVAIEFHIFGCHDFPTPVGLLFG